MLGLRVVLLSSERIGLTISTLHHSRRPCVQHASHQQAPVAQTVQPAGYYGGDYNATNYGTGPAYGGQQPAYGGQQAYVADQPVYGKADVPYGAQPAYGQQGHHGSAI
jgi:hypothetical protein